MQTNLLKKIVFYSLMVFCIAGCRKIASVYYPDKETPGVAIFSNTGNNVFSCFINNRPWRTDARTYGYNSNYYEIYINRSITSSPSDTLYISWNRLFTSSANNGVNEMDLVLPITKNFSIKDLSAWQGKRLLIDGSNGYFTINTNRGSVTGIRRGTGTIYFNTAAFDSTSLNGYSGSISGLLQATIDTLQITSGRFDHNMTADQVELH